MGEILDVEKGSQLTNGIIEGGWSLSWGEPELVQRDKQ
jgi:hypothetical protein